MEQNIPEIIKRSISRADAIRNLGWKYGGGTQSRLKKYIEDNNIDVSHFLSAGEATNLRLRGNSKPYQTIEKICPVCQTKFTTLVNHPRAKVVCGHGCSNIYFRSGPNNGQYKDGHYGAKKYRVICFQYWPKICAIPDCGWDKIVEVHHIDFNHKNNDYKNLIPLCSNHHGLTVTLKYRDEINSLIAQLVRDKFADLDQR